MCAYVLLKTLNQSTYHRIERNGSSGNIPDLYPSVSVFEYRSGH
jgi:hypothetical protein